jgi:hypothetical protein
MTLTLWKLMSNHKKYEANHFIDLAEEEFEKQHWKEFSMESQET